MIAYTDGATWQTNPGPCGAGIVFMDDSSKDPKNQVVIHTICEALGYGSSNDAEWLALILAVEWFLTETDEKTMTVRSDSQLIVNQANKRFVIRKQNLQVHAKRFFYLMKIARKLGRKVTVEWIRREENGHADKISKAAASIAADTVGLGPPDA